MSAEDRVEAGELVKLSFDQINKLGNGQAEDAIDRAFKIALADLGAWGRDGRARKVAAEVAMKATPDGRIEIAFKADAVLPGEKVKKTTGYFEAKADSPEAIFNPACADNPDQMTIASIRKEP